MIVAIAALFHHRAGQSLCDHRVGQSLCGQSHRVDRVFLLSLMSYSPRQLQLVHLLPIRVWSSTPGFVQLEAVMVDSISMGRLQPLKSLCEAVRMCSTISQVIFYMVF